MSRKEIFKTFWILKKVLNRVGIFLLLVFFVILWSSCTDQENEFTLGVQYLESGTSIYIKNDFEMEFSTVILDSIVSSGTGTMLIGRHHDDYTGTTTCKSFFTVDLPTSYDIDDEDIFDSLCLYIKYTGYSFGDTTLPCKYSIHQMIDLFELNEEESRLYNHSSFLFKEEALASVNFEALPSTEDSLVIPLSESFGRELFNKFLDSEDNDVKSSSEFQNYIKGLVIEPDDGQFSPVIGFLADPEHLYLKMFYHRIGKEEEYYDFDFPLYSTEYQFNQIQHDFTGTDIQSLVYEDTALLSENSGNVTFLQGGIGLVSRINFPNLSEILLLENTSLLRAELVLKPSRHSYIDYSLPTNICLYETDKANIFGNSINDDNGSVQSPVYAIDEIFHDDTYFTFDVTDFVNDRVVKSYFDPEDGLIVSLSSSTYMTTLDRFVLDALEDKPVLKIYLLSY